MDAAKAVKAIDGVSLIDSLIAQSKPVDDIIEVHGIKFKAITNHAVWEVALAKATSFVKTCKKKTVPPKYKPFLIEDTKVQVECGILGAMVVEPVISELDFMRLAFEAPLLYRAMVDAWDKNNRGKMAAQDDEAVEEAKKDSQTLTTDPE